jgi:cell division transport system ATP-binding protein
MIRFENVTYDFGLSDWPALDDISFAIDEGEFVFITGHSGSGKTTLLRLLLRELQPTVGAVYFQDQDLARLSRKKVAKHRQKVGVVFQDYQLLDDLTVRENIALPLVIAKLSKDEINDRIGELMKLLGLEGLENVFPAQLSGGEAQRVGLARALAVAPKIVFADEPTGNLDRENTLAILNLLQGINHYGTTIVFATHNLDLIPMTPNARHLKLEQGKLAHDTGCQIKKPKAKPVESEAEPSAAKTSEPKVRSDKVKKGKKTEVKTAKEAES